MRAKLITTIMIALFLASLANVVVLSVSAKTTKTYYTGSEVWVETLYDGEWWFSDGIVRGRGSVDRYTDTTTDPRRSGETTVVLNIQFNTKTGTATLWGTFTVVSVVDGGYWEGAWTGTRHADGSVSVRSEGHGRGLFEGLKFKETIEFISEGNGAISGYILESDSA